MNGLAAAFFQGQLRTHGHTEALVLEPAVEVCYERATLADPETGARVTIDSGIRRLARISRSRWTRPTSSSRPKVAVPPVWRTRSSGTSARARSR